jgi:hypothetical protein
MLAETPGDPWLRQKRRRDAVKFDDRNYDFVVR